MIRCRIKCDINSTKPKMNQMTSVARIRIFILKCEWGLRHWNYCMILPRPCLVCTTSTHAEDLLWKYLRLSHLWIGLTETHAHAAEMWRIFHVRTYAVSKKWREGDAHAWTLLEPTPAFLALPYTHFYPYITINILQFTLNTAIKQGKLWMKS